MAALPSLRLAYLCLEAPREGQASYVHVHEIIGGLRRRGWQVDLIAPRYSGSWRRPGIGIRMLEYLRLQLLLTLRLSRYDVVYVRAHPLAWPLAMLARALRRPVVQEVNGTFGDLYVAHPVARVGRRLFDFMQRRQYRAAAALVPVTSRLAEWLRRDAGDGTPLIRVISNGANTLLFAPDAPRRPGLPVSYAVFFGGLARWHGVDDMLAALQSPDWPPGVALIVAGDGPEMPRLQAVAARDARLVLLGRLDYREVPGVVAGSLAGLVPISDPGGRSSAAGLAPLKLFEILACGVPAVVSDLPGQGELVRAGACGLTYEAGDGPGLARAVAALQRDPAGAGEMGRRGRELACAEHSWDRRAADTDALLRGLLDSGSGSLPRR